MKKVFIHIGLPKTGTTAIQTYLDSHRRSLEKAGYDCVPIEMCHNFAISLLAKSLNWDYFSSKNEKDNILYLYAIFSLSETYLKHHLSTAYINDIKYYIENSKSENIILSSEFFSYASVYDILQKKFNSLILNIFYKVHLSFICYIRNIEDLVVSFYKEIIKEGINAIPEQNSNILYTPKADWIFPNYISGLANGHFSNLVPETIVDFYTEICGKENLIIKKYGDRASGFDVVSDFLSIFSLQKEEKFQKSYPINPSLTKELAAYRVAYGKDDSPPAEDIGFRSCLARMALDHLGKIDPQTSSRLAESAAALHRRYGVDCSFSAETLHKQLSASVSDFELFVCTALGKLSKQNNAILRHLHQETLASPPALFSDDSICQVFLSPVPDKYTYQRHVGRIFDSRWLTSGGPYVQELERALTDFLQVPFVLCCANDSLMLMLVLELEELAGKKIALTPCAAPRVLSVLRWLHCRPVFVDINEKNLSISPAALQEALAREPDIAAVIASHAFGICCDVEALSGLCRQHGVKLIFDADNAFGANLLDRSLLDFGDYAICSLHASHSFHAVEGGCIVSHTVQAQKRLEQLRSGGQSGTAHQCYGINANMSELHASFGLSLLSSVPAGIKQRAAIVAFYDENLFRCDKGLRMPSTPLYFQSNYACYPVIMPSEAALNAVVQRLNAKNIFPKRPYSPLLTQLLYLESELYHSCPIAEDISARILCLPIFAELPQYRLQTIVEIMRANQMQ